METSYFDINRPGAIACITEEDYDRQMNRVVAPYLKQYRKSGCQSNLYYELYPTKQKDGNECQGTIVISHGFGESCLKYHELIYYFHRQGYQVAIQDHRGHGRSFREVKDKDVIHIDDFFDYVKDLHNFVHKKVLPMVADRPLYLFAHSMGGCIGALYLQEYPNDFSKAVLNAPMFGLKMEKSSLLIGRIICGLMIKIKRGPRKLFFHPRFRSDESFVNCSADSQARFNYYHARRKKYVSYQTAVASYQWSLAADRAGFMVVNKKRLRRVKAAVLLFQAEADSLVTALEHKTFLDGIKAGKLVIVPATKHEIYRSSNTVLSRYLEMIFDFL